MRGLRSKLGLDITNDQELHREKRLEKDDDVKSCNEHPSLKPSSSAKPNNFPTALLILAFILANIEVSKGMNCRHSTDIKWISKRTNRLVGCTPCQRCPIAHEFSIPCGVKAHIGTTAKCIPCPPGTYSSGFNFKPCVSCTLCSNRIVEQNCTHSRNSVCGDCKPGFYYENVTFSCIKCEKCCFDGKDETHSSCSVANLCKNRPFGCPPKQGPVTSSRRATATSGSLHYQSANWSVPSFQQTMKLITTPNFHSQEKISSGSFSTGQSNTNDKKQKPNSRYSNNGQLGSDTYNSHPWILSLVVILCVLVVVLIIIIVILKKSFLMTKLFKINSSGCSDAAVENQYRAVNQEASPSSADMLPLKELNEDQTLEQFIHENYHVIDELCKLLCHRRLGMWDFEHLAKKWQIKKLDVEGLKNEIHVEQGSPVRTLLDVLCCQRLCTTVRQLADSVKSINPDAYEILKPHILKPNVTNKSC